MKGSKGIREALHFIPAGRATSVRVQQEPGASEEEREKQSQAFSHFSLLTSLLSLLTLSPHFSLLDAGRAQF